MKITGYKCWASSVMPSYQFQQLQAAFHPEYGQSEIGDKCHYLRHALQCLNAAARRSFALCSQASFDEGGVANHFRYNPCLQYNQSKPDKYRIDFFILPNACNDRNFIYHIDCYRGKNAGNVFVDEELWEMTTTQKAVLNAVIQAKLSRDPDGQCEIYLDNQYTLIPLFIILREKHDIRACGTVCSNQKGCDTTMMNLQENAQQGTTILKYAKIKSFLGSGMITKWFRGFECQGKLMMMSCQGEWDRMSWNSQQMLL